MMARNDSRSIVNGTDANAYPQDIETATCLPVPPIALNRRIVVTARAALKNLASLLEFGFDRSGSAWI